MKKLSLIIASAGFLFASCQKDNMSSPGSSTDSGLKTISAATSPAVPSSFIKKVMVEEITGTSYSLVPEASDDLQQLILINKGRIYSAGLHVGDAMNTIQTNYVLTAMGNTNPAIPCGLVNRDPLNGNLFLDSKQFAAAAYAELAQSVNCGLSIATSINNGTASVNISTGFLSNMSGAYKLVTYLTEDNVINYNSAFYQANGFNNTAGSKYYNVGNPIHGFMYSNVVRRTLSRLNGDPIASASVTAGGIATFNYQIDMPQQLSPSGHYKILSFIVEANTNRVINVQECLLGSTKGWN